MLKKMLNEINCNRRHNSSIEQAKEKTQGAWRQSISQDIVGGEKEKEYIGMKTKTIGNLVHY